MPRYNYTASEYADMIFVYGECHGNANLAIQKYRERYGTYREFKNLVLKKYGRQWRHNVKMNKKHYKKI